MPQGPRSDITDFEPRFTAVMASQLLGEVKERQAGSGTCGRPVSNGRFAVPTAGFPVAHHRSRNPSAFAKARVQQLQSLQMDSSGQSRPPVRIPSVAPVAAGNKAREPGAVEGLDGDWRGQMQRQNEEMLLGMSEEEKQREREGLLAQFGGGLVDLVKKARARREGKVRADHLNDTSLIPNSHGDRPLISNRTRISSREPQATRTTPSSRSLHTSNTHFTS
jgi:hypothetical protein